MDTTFCVKGYYVVFAVIQHPELRQRERTNVSPVLVAGVMFTRSLCEESYRLFPGYIRQRLVQLGIDIQHLHFNLITDGERALYNSWLHTFPSNLSHALCVVHLRRCMRRRLLREPTLGHGKVSSILNDIFSSRIADSLLRASSVCDYRAKELILFKKWKSTKWQRIFERYYSDILLEKVVRVNLSFKHDKADYTTNISEAFNRKFKSVCGNKPVGLCSAVMRYFLLLGDQETSLVLSTVNKGPFKGPRLVDSSLAQLPRYSSQVSHEWQCFISALDVKVIKFQLKLRPCKRDYL